MSRLFFDVLQVAKTRVPAAPVSVPWPGSKAIAAGDPKLQDSPGPSRPAFSSLFCNGLSSSGPNGVQDEKAKVRDATRHDIRVVSDCEPGRRRGEKRCRGRETRGADKGKQALFALTKPRCITDGVK
jgi:hypothetical protein